MQHAIPHPQHTFESERAQVIARETDNIKSLINDIFLFCRAARSRRFSRP